MSGLKECWLSRVEGGELEISRSVVEERPYRVLPERPGGSGGQ